MPSGALELTGKIVEVGDFGDVPIDVDAHYQRGVALTLDDGREVRITGLTKAECSLVAMSLYEPTTLTVGPR